MPSSDAQKSAYANMTPWSARWVIGIFCGFATLLVAISVSPYRIAFYDRQHNTSDLELYWAEVHRVANGESYYEAANTELTERGHPTFSVFNWRTPLPMWLLAKLPDPEYGRWILTFLGATLLLGGILAMRREGSLAQSLLCGLFLSGTTVLCVVGDLFVMPVLWGGVLIGLSLCAYCFDRVMLAVLFGTAAMIFRELALPYCVFMAAAAAWRRQRSEVVWWSIGLTGFAIFYAVHTFHVVEFAGTGKIANTDRWIRFNGLSAVVGFSQNGFLLLFPQWVTALYLSCALLGMGSWRSSFGRRVAGTAVMYLSAFAVVGHEVNQYWGTLVTPILCFGAARAPQAFVDLLVAAGWRRYNS